MLEEEAQNRVNYQTIFPTNWKTELKTVADLSVVMMKPWNQIL